MLLQFRRDQMRVARPGYFWGCTGWYLHRADPRHCANTERVTNADLGVLLRRDNEALAMDRAERGGAGSRRRPRSPAPIRAA
jgi:hypothetical protein